MSQFKPQIKLSIIFWSSYPSSSDQAIHHLLIKLSIVFWSSYPSSLETVAAASSQILARRALVFSISGQLSELMPHAWHRSGA